MKILPLFPRLPSYRYAVDLDGRVFRLRLRYLDRPDSWYLDVARDDGTNLSTGIRVITDWPLFPGRRKGADFPAGQLICIDMTGQGRYPSRFDLSPEGFARLVFVPDSELPPPPTNPDIREIVVT